MMEPGIPDTSRTLIYNADGDGRFRNVRPGLSTLGQFWFYETSSLN
jgi:hypothetical protein